MRAQTGRRNLENARRPALGSWLPMTRGHRHTQPGIGPIVAARDSIVNVTRSASLRRISLTSLHIGARHQRRTRSLQFGILWVGLSRRVGAGGGVAH